MTVESRQASSHYAEQDLTYTSSISSMLGEKSM